MHHRRRRRHHQIYWHLAPLTQQLVQQEQIIFSGAK